MTTIPTDRFKPKRGSMHAFVFENRSINLAPTLFYSIDIPLKPFSSGLDHESQPVKTSFSLEFIRIPVVDWRRLDRQSFEIAQDDCDGSIYVGSAHNPVNINQIRFKRAGNFMFRIDCTLFCDFESEGVADDAQVELSADIKFEGLRVLLDPTYTEENILKAIEIAARRGEKQALKYVKEVNSVYASEQALEAASKLVDLTGYASPRLTDGQLTFRPKAKGRRAS
jgi:hypothetical protein